MRRLSTCPECTHRGTQIPHTWGHTHPPHANRTQNTHLYHVDTPSSRHMHTNGTFSVTPELSLCGPEAQKAVSTPPEPCPTPSTDPRARGPPACFLISLVLGSHHNEG